MRKCLVLSHFVSFAPGVGELVGMRDRPAWGVGCCGGDGVDEHGTTIARAGAMAIGAYVSVGVEWRRGYGERFLAGCASCRNDRGDGEAGCWRS